MRGSQVCKRKEAKSPLNSQTLESTNPTTDSLVRADPPKPKGGDPSPRVEGGHVKTVKPLFACVGLSCGMWDLALWHTDCLIVARGFGCCTTRGS